MSVWVVFRSGWCDDPDELLGVALTLDDVHRIVPGYWVRDSLDLDYADHPTGDEYAVRVPVNRLRESNALAGS